MANSIGSQHDTPGGGGHEHGRSRAVPTPADYRLAIAEACRFATHGLGRLLSEAGPDGGDRFLAEYDRWQRKRCENGERIAEIPLLIALAALRGGGVWRKIVGRTGPGSSGALLSSRAVLVR